jgi:hypothetical protein
MSCDGVAGGSIVQMVVQSNHGLESDKARGTAMTQDSPDLTEQRSDGLRRRDFLWSALGATALMVTASWERAPAVISGEKPHVTMLSWNNFVPETDVELRRQADEYTKHAGVQVTLDFMAHLQLPAKTAAEAQAQLGHDIIFSAAPGGGSL